MVATIVGLELEVQGSAMPRWKWDKGNMYEVTQFYPDGFWKATFINTEPQIARISAI
jgi:hypothetical protein